MTMKKQKTLHRFAAVAAVLLAFCLVFMMPVGADGISEWNGVSVDTEFTGSGTEESPYLITSAAELAGMAKLVNEYQPNDDRDKPYNRKHFKLDTDIDLKNNEWMPIANSTSHGFHGFFDGNGHTISNLKITEQTKYAGLFGEFRDSDGGSSLINLTISNVQIGSPDSQDKAPQVSGALVGFSAVGLVKDCSVIGTINIYGGEQVGGLIGTSYSSIENCKVDGNDNSVISGRYISDNNKGHKIGGLVGYQTCQPGSLHIKSSSVENIEISGNGHVGGLVGYLATDIQVTSSSVTDTSVTLKYDSNYESYVKGKIDGNKYDNYLSVGALVGASKSNVDDNVGGDTRFIVGIFVDEEYKASDYFNKIAVGFVGAPAEGVNVDVNNHDLSSESVTNLGNLGLLKNFGYCGVTFDSGDGSAVDAQFVKSGENAIEPATPTKEGYTFTGWSLDGELYDFNTLVTEDITLTANWNKNEYTITPSVSKVGFDSVKVGYTQPEAQIVTITNDGNVPVTIEASISGNYDISVDKTVLSADGADEKATLTIKPIAGLAVGNYEDKLTITVKEDGKSYSIPVSFLVYQPSSGGSSKPVEEPEEPVEPEVPVEPETPTEEPEAGEATVETEVTDGGEVELETPTAGGSAAADEDEAKITGVVLPTGTDSEVTFVPVSEQAAPAGKETQTKKVFEINVPTYEKGKPATIKFTMTVAELEADGKEAADVALWHFDEETGEWTKLVTSYTIVDGVVYFEAITEDFSPFAIIYEDEPEGDMPGNEPQDKPETPESPAPVLGLLAALGAAVVLRRK